MAEEPRRAETSSTSLIILEVDGERVEVSQEVAVGWRDILRAKQKIIVDYKEPLSPTFPTEFNYSVLTDLREDIDLLRTASMDKPTKEWISDAEVYKILLVRYHPDLYHGEAPEVQQLATEYSQALVAMKEAGILRVANSPVTS